MVDACKILGVSRNTLKRLIREGIVPAYEVQGVAGYKLRRDEVEALIEPVVVLSHGKKPVIGSARASARSRRKAGSKIRK